MSRKRILLCEDDQFQKKILTKLLELEGHRVWAFDTADEALARGPSVLEEIDVLVTDVDMPGTDGIELAQEIKSIDPSITIIIMSGHYVDLKSIQKIGAAFFSKPFSYSSMLKAVAQTNPVLN